MRHPSRCAVFTAATLALAAGCTTTTDTPAATTAATPERAPREVDPDLLAQIQQTADDLAALDDPGPGPSADTTGSPPATGSPVVASGRPVRANLSPAVEIDPAGEPAAEAHEPHDDAPAAAAEAADTVSDATKRLAAALRADAGADPIRVYAALAALEMLEPGVMVNPASVRGLSPEDARILEAWADLMRSADAGLLSSPDDPRALSGALLDAAEAARGFERLAISATALCSRVEGFGRYTTMGSTWLAGRAHKAIVYAEVTNFATTAALGPSREQGREVRLTQELQLFHDADGLLAWRMPPQRVTDFSRNERRDFFIVQMIDLPASLSVGRYQLKVSVRDEISGDVSESVMPITIVADAGLIGPPAG